VIIAILVLVVLTTVKARTRRVGKGAQLLHSGVSQAARRAHRVGKTCPRPDRWSLSYWAHFWPRRKRFCPP